MSTRNWCAFAALGVIFISLLGWYGWREYNIYELEHAKERGKISTYHDDNYDEYVRSCSVEKNYVLKLMCLIKAVDSNRDAQRSKYDLKAQQDMAEFAYGVLLLSAAGLILTSIGIGFVLWTIMTALQANKIANDDFLTAHPPIIKVFQAHLDFDAIFNPIEHRPFGGVYIVNVGGSDARITNDNSLGFPTYGNIVLFIGKNSPDRKPFEIMPRANSLNVLNGKLKSGGSLWWDITDISMININCLRDVVERSADDKLFMIGRIHFMDARDANRQTVFCRVYDHKSERFTDSGIQDYEYQA